MDAGQNVQIGLLNIMVHPGSGGPKSFAFEKMYTEAKCSNTEYNDGQWEWRTGTTQTTFFDKRSQGLFMFTCEV